MADLVEFYNTRALLLGSTGYTRPLSFDEWKEKPDSLKVGLLFLQFFNEITLAWTKADTRDFGDSGEGVSVVMQYLQKNVKQVQYFLKSNPTKKAPAEFVRKHPDQCISRVRRIIESSPSKFSSRYIYKTAYNCLYCICGHDRKRDKDQMENETSSIVMYDGEELDLFDTLPDKHGSTESKLESSNFESEFWSIIESAGPSAEKVMRYLLSNDAADLKALSKRSKKYEADPLRSIEVSLDAVESILEELREKFLELPFDSSCGEYISNFNSILKDDDEDLFLDFA